MSLNESTGFYFDKEVNVPYGEMVERINHLNNTVLKVNAYHSPIIHVSLDSEDGCVVETVFSVTDTEKLDTISVIVFGSDDQRDQLDCHILIQSSTLHTTTFNFARALFNVLLDEGCENV